MGVGSGRVGEDVALPVHIPGVRPCILHTLYSPTYIINRECPDVRVRYKLKRNFFNPKFDFCPF